ncbi:DinB family protein [Neobacillus piezotolerans]|nr:DinB family protein [Neobacillus piezotolerans]
MANDVLLDQLAAAHKESGWFTCLDDALKGITYERVFWSPKDEANSVFGIVQHLAYWSEVYLERYKPGAIGEIAKLKNNETFQIPDGEKTEELWLKTRARFEKSYTGWRKVIEEDPEKLVEDDWWKHVSHFSLHNAYHIGQIVTLRKLQGSWIPPEQ